MALPAPDSEQDARRMAEEWAISRGYMSLEDYQRQSYTGVSVKMSHGGWFRFPGLRVPAVEQSINAPTSAADLGVTAREYRPTAEQMAAGRRALGLE